MNTIKDQLNSVKQKCRPLYRRVLQWRMMGWLRWLNDLRHDRRNWRWSRSMLKVLDLSWGQQPHQISYQRPPLPPDFPSRRRDVTVVPNVLVVSCESADGMASARVDEVFGGKVNLVHTGVASAVHTFRMNRKDIDLVLFTKVGIGLQVAELIAEARKAYLPTATLCDRPLQPENEQENDPAQNGDSTTTASVADLYATFRAADFSICPDQQLATWSERNEMRAVVPSGNGTRGVNLIEELRQRHRARYLPNFSVVSILHGKAEQIEPALESWFRQSYRGDFELIYVDDQSPDDSTAIVMDYFNKAKASGKYARLPDVRVLRNDENLGNCISRNRGIAAATGDIIIVIDADCMVNADFIRAHADAHAFGDGDVVIGPLQRDIGRNSHPLNTLASYEAQSDRLRKVASPQDPLNPRSFLNCVPRNFSIRRDFIEGDLFDPAFSYSMDPESGFGWEDVEMGYRFYTRGARIKFTPEAFSLHISHPPSVEEQTKPLRSMLNFRRLHEKHPDLRLVARRWSLGTYEKICAWADRNGQPVNDDRKYLDEALNDFRPPRFNIGNERKLKILTYRWHVPHQYELYKLPYEFALATDVGTSMTNHWAFNKRPLPKNAHLVPIEDIKVSNYDLAVLHFDENVLSPQNTNGVIPANWGETFRWFQENVKLPKVAICHGTPQFFGQYDGDYRGANLMEPIEEERQRLVEFLGDTLVVTNSHQAYNEWQFRRSKVIWHGFDPTEFPPGTYEKGILSPITSRPHYRGHFLYRKVFEGFPNEFRPSPLYVPDPDLFYTEAAYAVGKFREYVNTVRRFSVYFNPTLRSPMPRARGEAMMCGLVTVSADNHDVDRFIENGVNGFRSSDAGELREMLLFLMKNPTATRKIGAAGRRTAMDLFNHDRYLNAWNETISEVIG